MTAVPRSAPRRTTAALACFAAALLAAPAALADEARGMVVWFDAKNAALLFECADGGCAQIPSAKSGETYTFVVPPALAKTVAALQEGQKVTLQYDDRKLAGYVLVSVK